MVQPKPMSKGNDQEKISLGIQGDYTSDITTFSQNPSPNTFKEFSHRYKLQGFKGFTKSRHIPKLTTSGIIGFRFLKK